MPLKWFDKDFRQRAASGRRRGASRSRMLRVNTRRSSPVGLWQKTACILLVLAIVAAAVVLVREGAGVAGELIFSRNKRFTIRRLDITAGRTITPDLVREYLQIHEGMNLFAIDLKGTRTEFLERCPGVESMAIRRVLPDTLSIVITEREPIARLASPHRLVVDADGIVFRVPTDTRRLPLVTGYADRELGPSDRVGPDVREGLRVLQLCQEPSCSIPVDEIRVDRPKHFILYLGGGHAGRRIRVPRPGKVSGDAAGNIDLRDRLAWVARAINSEEGRRRTVWDATYRGRIYAR